MLYGQGKISLRFMYFMYGNRNMIVKCVCVFRTFSGLSFPDQFLNMIFYLNLFFHLQDK